MPSSLLDSVLDTTLAAAAEGESKLDRFVALGDWDALAFWLRLEEDGEIPTPAEITGRLTYDVALIDELLSRQIDVILHTRDLQRLESSWRGLRRLTRAVDDDDHVKIRLLDVTWAELAKDLERAIEFSQSHLFSKIYSAEFGMPGGEPFGVLIGDYEIRHTRTSKHRTDDIGTLRAIAEVAAAAFAPFIASAHPALFGLDSFAELERSIDLHRVFSGPEYTAWNSLRKLEDVRFVGLTLPRTLMRQPYGDDPGRADGFRYQEDISAPDGASFLWGSAGWAFAEVLVRTFQESGWMANIRGVTRDRESGGLVTTLPAPLFRTDPASEVTMGSLEVQLTDDQEKDLGDLGFIALSHCHGTPFAAFYGNQSLQRWIDPAQEAKSRTVGEVNAKLSSMLQYMFCVSRFAHYVKVICRDKLGSYSGADEIERVLNDWLVSYATSNESASAETHAKYPLRDARVEVQEIPGRPGIFQSVVHLRPHYQLDQMTSSVKLVTELFASREI